MSMQQQTPKTDKMRRKRQLSPEISVLEIQHDSQKLSKQSKLEKYFEPAKSPQSIPPQNCVCFDPPVTIDFESFSPLTKGLIKDLIDEQKTQAPLVKGKVQPTCSSEVLLHHTLNIAKDVKHNLSLLENIFSLLKERLLKPPAHNTHQQEANYHSQAPESQPLLPPLHQFPLPLEESPSSKLILKSSSIALSIIHQPGVIFDWSQPWMIKKHLASILKLNSSNIDLCNYVRLPPVLRQQRVLLHFNTCRIPNRILLQSQRFRALGIFPQRHFQNLIIRKLFSTHLQTVSSPLEKSTHLNGNSTSTIKDSVTAQVSPALPNHVLPPKNPPLLPSPPGRRGQPLLFTSKTDRPQQKSRSLRRIKNSLTLRPKNLSPSPSLPPAGPIEPSNCSSFPSLPLLQTPKSHDQSRLTHSTVIPLCSDDPLPPRPSSSPISTQLSLHPTNSTEVDLQSIPTVPGLTKPINQHLSPVCVVSKPPSSEPFVLVDATSQFPPPLNFDFTFVKDHLDGSLPPPPKH